MDVNQIIPSNLINKSAAHHLYDKGLCFTRMGDERRRNFFHKPIVIFTVLMVQLIKNIVLIVTPDDWRQVFIVLGDFAYFINMKYTLNTACILFNTLGTSTMLIYYYNHKNGIRPTFLWVFRMTSGSVTPRSVGLTDGETVLTFIRRTDLLFRFIKIFIERAVLTVIFAVYFFPLATNFTLKESLLFAIPNTLLFQAFVYYCYSIIFYKMVYLYLICYYLKAKIRSINKRAIHLMETKRYESLYQLMASIDKIYAEVNEYNMTFWSKYLLMFWLTFGAVIVFLMIITFFIEMTMVYRLVWGFITAYLSVIFLIIIISASSVNTIANESYKLFNRLFVDYSGVDRRSYVRTRGRLFRKFKVF